MDRALNPLALTHAHYLLLASLKEFLRSGAMPSQRELADYAGLEVMYVSKLARALERGGLLGRADHPDDPRAFQLELTARGAERVEAAAAVVRELYDQLLGPIGGPTSKEHAALIQTLETLLDEAEAFGRAKGTRAMEAVSRPHERSRRRS